MEYTPRLGMITSEQIQAALDRFGLGRFRSARTTGVGLAGQTLFVEAGTGSYVLRGNPLFPGQFDKEAFFVRLLHSRAPVPVPWPYWHDATTDIFGWPYVLMPRLPGYQADVGTVSKLEPTDQLGVVVALAEALAGLHDVSWPVCGEYRLAIDGIEPLEVPWADWVASRVREKVDRVREGPGAITPRDAEWAEHLLGSGMESLREDFSPGFTMHDYTQYNVVFSHHGATWHVCGLFDLAEAYMGDGEADLARPTEILLRRDPALAHAFVRQYLTLRPPRPGFAERFAVYMLDDILIGWASRRRRAQHPNASLRDLSEPYTSAGMRLARPAR